MDESSPEDKWYGWALVVGAILVLCWLFPVVGGLFLGSFFFWIFLFGSKGPYK